MFIDYKFRYWANKTIFIPIFILPMLMVLISGKSSFTLLLRIALIMPIYTFITLFARFKINDEMTDKILLETRSYVFTVLFLIFIVIGAIYAMLSFNNTHLFGRTPEDILTISIGAVAWIIAFISDALLLKKLRRAGYSEKEINNLTT